MSKQKYGYIKQEDGTIAEMDFAKALKLAAKASGHKPGDFEQAVKDAVKGRGLDAYPDLDKDDIAHWKPIYKDADKFVKDSAKFKAELSQQILDAEEAEKKRGELIVLAADKGAELSTNFSTSMVDALQKAVGKKFEVTETGLSVAKDVTIDEEEAAKLIATLAESTERETKLRTTVNLALGDAIIAVKGSFANADELIEQVVELRGQSKHTVQDTERVVKFINELYDATERPAGLTYTHWQESKNYARNKKGEKMIPDAKVKKIIEKVLKGEDGKILSCADMRALLKAELPRDEPSGDEGGEGESEASEKEAKVKALFGFLYIDLADTDNIVFLNELDKSMLKETDENGLRYLTLDLAGKCSLKENGKKDKAFASAPVAVVEVPEAGDDMPE